MSKSNISAVLKQIETFPSLPAIVSRVMTITANPESSASEMMEAILPDPSMSATILKIANSAFFGLPREVGTIEKAVMVLGFDEIKNIVLGKAVFNSFKQFKDKNKKSIDDFWAHSFTCGLAAKILAERIDLSPSEMFTAGLIHDIGKLAMLITFPCNYVHLLNMDNDSRFTSYEQEQELFSICHDKVAHQILNRWLFPQQLLLAVGYHHRPQETDESPLLPSVIQVADIVAHIFFKSKGMSTLDHKEIILNFCPEIFDLWQDLDLPCSSDEVKTWFKLLQASHDRDTAILTIFSS